MDSLAISIVEFLLNLSRAYLFAGLVFAVVFVIFFVGRVDHSAQGGSIGFRIMIIPGLCALWPIFAVRLLRGKTTPTERTAHRLKAAKHSHQA